MSTHGVTCAAPQCPFYEENLGECRKARPTGYQPSLSRNEYWPLWVQLDGTQPGSWCGEHPAVRAFARRQTNEEPTDERA
jgi:hypothetical protein